LPSPRKYSLPLTQVLNAVLAIKTSYRSGEAREGKLNKCKNCGKEFEPVDKRHPFQVFCCRKCKNKYYQNNYNRSGGAKRNRIRKRFEALAVLGGKCVACGTADPLLLTFDHIANDWRNDGIRRHDKVGLCRWIIANPEKARVRIQVLCWNDNSLKQFYPDEFKKRFPLVKSIALGP